MLFFAAVCSQYFTSALKILYFVMQYFIWFMIHKNIMLKCHKKYISYISK